MCGVFGIISDRPIDKRLLEHLAIKSERRGKDSSGFFVYRNGSYEITRADYRLTKLLSHSEIYDSPLIVGHSRLVTNSTVDNQPVLRDGVLIIHNGIVVNDSEIWQRINKTPNLAIDSEVIAALAADYILNSETVEGLDDYIGSFCNGTMACAILVAKLGKLVLFSNNGSLYTGKKGNDIIFASEAATLSELACVSINQIKGSCSFDVPTAEAPDRIRDINSRTRELVPVITLKGDHEDLLVREIPDLRRCKKCVLPYTFPFISFNSDGVCNYCENYTIRSAPKDPNILRNLVKKYRRSDGRSDCIVPLSGGRDSCFALHLAVHELGLRPVTYTYDWAMVTDLARRNVSRMCAHLGIENIVVADDIALKRKYIRMNLKAFLKAPHLGMVSILTAGDKHFFRHIETIKDELDIRLNLWGVNPLEVTHFKTGFLGVPPDFSEKMVYTSKWSKQFRYHALRLRAMTQSLGYFNASLWDTLSGEYYRSFVKKDAYFHVFDYWAWDEHVINNTLTEYGWESAVDTKSTWRIGDGTAAFYNYVYHTIAGFTEHDTFRSNQIREGIIGREEALNLVLTENQPRYANIKWYLDTLGMDFVEVIRRINEQPRLYYKHDGE